MLRAHVMRLLEQLRGETGSQPVSRNLPTEAPKPTLVRSEAPATTEPSDRLLSVEEVAKLLGKSKSWVYKRSLLNEISRHKIGGHLRFRRSEIEAWIDVRAGKLL